MVILFYIANLTIIAALVPGYCTIALWLSLPGAPLRYPFGPFTRRSLSS